MKYISVSSAPQPAGPYSQAVLSDDGTVYISGQLPIDPETGTITAKTPPAQARQALTNIQSILAGADLTLKDVLRVGVFITDMSSFADVNEVYAEFFPDGFPARSVIGVVSLPHAAAQVEIEVTAQHPARV